MFVLGLQGSPRRRGNTADLLTAVLAAAAELGARTQAVEVCRREIRPCIGCGTCERKGVCVHTDEMSTEIFGLLREADAVVLATPIYFYNATAQLKALIDRTQTLWARRYRFKLVDPGSRIRRGLVLSLAATRGRNLFEGLALTAQYFFDAIDARSAGALQYRGIEEPGDLKRQVDLDAEARKAAADLLQPLQGRRRVLVLDTAAGSRGLMAAALVRQSAGERLDPVCGCLAPAPPQPADAAMVAAMAQAGIDAAYLRPRGLEECLTPQPPELVIALDGDPPDPRLAHLPHQRWPLAPAPQGGDVAGFERLREEILQRIQQLPAM